MLVVKTKYQFSSKKKTFNTLDVNVYVFRVGTAKTVEINDMTPKYCVGN